MKRTTPSCSVLARVKLKDDYAGIAYILLKTNINPYKVIESNDEESDRKFYPTERAMHCVHVLSASSTKNKRHLVTL